MSSSNIMRDIIRESADVTQTSNDNNRHIFNINYFHNYHYSDNRRIVDNDTRRNNNPISGRVISTTIPIVTRTNIVRTQSNNEVNENENNEEIINNVTQNVIQEALRNMIDSNVSDELNNFTNEQIPLNLNILNDNTEIFINNNIEEICAICNENYSTNKICRKNNKCGHYFHQKCIDTWYSENNKCPQCNQLIE